jgi:hypothetical protein
VRLDADRRSADTECRLPLDRAPAVGRNEQSRHQDEADEALRRSADAVARPSTPPQGGRAGDPSAFHVMFVRVVRAML